MADYRSKGNVDIRVVTEGGYPAPEALVTFNGITMRVDKYGAAKFYAVPAGVYTGEARFCGLPLNFELEVAAGRHNPYTVAFPKAVANVKVAYQDGRLVERAEVTIWVSDKKGAPPREIGPFRIHNEILRYPDLTDCDIEVEVVTNKGIAFMTAHVVQGENVIELPRIEYSDEAVILAYATYDDGDPCPNMAIQCYRGAEPYHDPVITDDQGLALITGLDSTDDVSLIGRMSDWPIVLSEPFRIEPFSLNKVWMHPVQHANGSCEIYKEGYTPVPKVAVSFNQEEVEPKYTDEKGFAPFTKFHDLHSTFIAAKGNVVRTLDIPEFSFYSWNNRFIIRDFDDIKGKIRTTITATPSGRPVRNAEVQVLLKTQVRKKGFTDKDGVFIAYGLEAAPDYEVIALYDNQSRTKTNVVVEDLKMTDVALSYADVGLTVHIFSKSGDDFPNALIEVFDKDDVLAVSGYTGQDGIFTTFELEAREYTVVASGDGNNHTRKSFTGHSGVTAQLEWRDFKDAVGSLEVYVRFERTKLPVADAAVYLTKTLRGSTSKKGVVVISGLDPGMYSGYVKYDGRLVSYGPIEIHAKLVTVVNTTYPDVDVTVITQTDKGVPYAKAKITASQTGYPDLEGITNDEGKWSTPLYSATLTSYTATGDGQVHVKTKVVTHVGPSVITFDDFVYTGKIRTHIYYKHGKNAANGARIEVATQAGKVYDSGFVDDYGYRLTSGLPDGEYKVTWYYDGKSDQANVDVKQGEISSCNFELEEPIVAAACFRDDGDPFEGATIEILTMDDRLVATAKTGDNGRVELMVPTVGEYKAKAYGDGRGHTMYQFRLAINERHDVEWKDFKDQYGILKIIVTFGVSKKPVIGAAVEVGGAPYGVTGADGTLRIPLDSGDYSGSITYAKEKHNFGPVRVKSKETTEVKDVYRDVYVDVLVVTQEHQTPFKGAPIKIEQKGFPPIEGVTDDKGEFSAIAGSAGYTDITALGDGKEHKKNNLIMALGHNSIKFDDFTYSGAIETTVILGTLKHPARGAVVTVLLNGKKVDEGLVDPTTGKRKTLGLANGTYQVEAYYDMNTKKQDIVVAQGQTAQAEFLYADAMLELITQRFGGDPYPLADFEIRNMSDILIASGKTDEQGRFVLNSPDAGYYYNVKAWGDGQEHPIIKVMPRCGKKEYAQWRDFKDFPGAVEFDCSFKLSKFKVPGAEIYINASKVGVTDKNGHFRMELNPGDYPCNILYVKEAMDEGHIYIKPKETTYVVESKFTDTVIAVTCQGERKLPYPGAAVSVTQTGYEEIKGTTGADGKVALIIHDASACEITALGDGKTHYKELKAKNGVNEVVFDDFVFDGGIITTALFKNTAKPCKGAIVKITDANQKVVDEGQVDSNGQRYTRNLPAGAYTDKVTYDALDIEKTGVVVENKKMTAVSATYEEPKMNVLFTTRYGLPVANAIVSIKQDKVEILTGLTDGEGKWNGWIPVAAQVSVDVTFEGKTYDAKVITVHCSQTYSLEWHDVFDKMCTIDYQCNFDDGTPARHVMLIIDLCQLGMTDELGHITAKTLADHKAQVKLQYGRSEWAKEYVDFPPEGHVERKFVFPNVVVTGLCLSKKRIFLKNVEVTAYLDYTKITEIGNGVSDDKGFYQFNCIEPSSWNADSVVEAESPGGEIFTQKGILKCDRNTYNFEEFKEPMGGVQGTVTFKGSGKPVVGCEIWVQFVKKCVTDQQGKFKLHGFEKGIWTIEFIAWEQKFRKNFEVILEEYVTVDCNTFPDTNLDVTIKSVTGLPWEHAKVVVDLVGPDLEGYTDKNGFIEWKQIGEWGQFPVVATGDGTEHKRDQVINFGDNHLAISDFKDKCGGYDLKATFADATNKPVGAFKTELIQNSKVKYWGTTDNTGVYHVDNVLIGEYNRTWTWGDYIKSDIIVIKENELFKEAASVPVPAVKCTCKTTKGTPCEGAVVVVSQLGVEIGRGVTNSAGEFTLPCYVFGAATLVANWEAQTSATKEFTLGTVVNPALVTIDTFEPPYGSATVHVFWKIGKKNIPNVTVSAMGKSPVNAVTNSEGIASFANNLRFGKYTFQGTWDNIVFKSPEVEIKGGELTSTEFTIDDMWVSVYCGTQGGNPREKMDVYLKREGNIVDQNVTGADGWTRMTMLLQAQHELTATGDGQTHGPRAVMAHCGTQTEKFLDFKEIQGSAEISLIFKTGGRQPIRGQEVIATNEATLQESKSTTDSNGIAKFPLLDPGQYKFLTVFDGKNFLLEHQTVKSKETLKLDIVIPDIIIDVFCATTDGVPRFGVDVVVKWSTWEAKGTTDNDGHAKLQVWWASDYNVTATADGKTHGPKVIFGHCGENLVEFKDFENRFADINILAMFVLESKPTGIPVYKADAYLVCNGKNYKSARTDKAGKCSFEDLPTGAEYKYDITVKYDTDKFEKLQFTLVEKQVLQVNAEITAVQVEATVLDRDKKPFAGAYVDFKMYDSPFDNLGHLYTDATGKGKTCLTQALNTRVSATGDGVAHTKEAIFHTVPTNAITFDDFGTEGGTVNVNVLFGNRAPVVGALAKLTKSGSGSGAQALTGADGKCSMAKLRPATYTLVVTYDNFTIDYKEPLIIVDKTTVITIDLTVATVMAAIQALTTEGKPYKAATIRVCDSKGVLVEEKHVTETGEAEFIFKAAGLYKFYGLGSGETYGPFDHILHPGKLQTNITNYPAEPGDMYGECYIDGKDYYPVDYVDITLIQEGYPSNQYRATTDKDGRWKITGATPGVYSGTAVVEDDSFVLEAQVLRKDNSRHWRTSHAFPEKVFTLTLDKAVKDNLIQGATVRGYRDVAGSWIPVPRFDRNPGDWGSGNSWNVLCTTHGKHKFDVYGDGVYRKGEDDVFEIRMGSGMTKYNTTTPYRGGTPTSATCEVLIIVGGKVIPIGEGTECALRETGKQDIKGTTAKGGFVAFYPPDIKADVTYCIAIKVAASWIVTPNFKITAGQVYRFKHIIG